MSKLKLKVFSYDSDIDDLVAQFKGKVSDALLKTGSQFARDVRKTIRDTYTFRDPAVATRYVNFRFDATNDMAHIKVINKSFSFTRLAWSEPRDYEGFAEARVDYDDKVGVGKMFTIVVGDGTRLMVSRSGIQKITEGWQEAHSKTPFTTDPAFDKMANRGRETVFKTYERKFPRKHTFKIVRTIRTTEMVMRHLDKLIKKLPKYFIHEITHTRTVFRKVVKKKEK